MDPHLTSQATLPTSGTRLNLDILRRSSMPELNQIKEFSEKIIGERKREAEHQETGLAYAFPKETLTQFTYLDSDTLPRIRELFRTLEIDTKGRSESGQSKASIVYSIPSMFLTEDNESALKVFYHHTLSAIRALVFESSKKLDLRVKTPLKYFNIEPLFQDLLKLRLMGIHSRYIYDTLHDAVLQSIRINSTCQTLDRDQKILMASKFTSKVLKKIIREKQKKTPLFLSSKSTPGVVPFHFFDLLLISGLQTSVE